ncbi:MAG TPA: hypothetical protein VMN39_00290 [Longimicrobiaceae bacterium]|nr:hypothetical protein [Longimicrobiaceae bacterium]
MKRMVLLATIAVVAAVFTACNDESPLSVPSDEGLVLAGKGNNNGGGGGSSGPIQIRMSGGFYTDSDQPGAIVSDNRNRTELFHDCSGTDLPGCMDYGIDFATVVGDLSACWTEPSDMDAATRAELEGQLDDAIQTRVFSSIVYKNGETKTFVKGIYRDDTNNERYEIRYGDASAAQDPSNPDHYTISGGTVKTWTVRDGVGLQLHCEVTGEALELTVIR